jgi:7,8-dihydropterin-6-yl-methyl-4-(beta-D-ribofuranosyl)aminobenzene 5'-phosphate synthase
MEGNMASVRRRSFLAGSVALVAASGWRRSAVADAPRLAPPAVDRLTIRNVIDITTDIFISGASPKDVRVGRVRSLPPPRVNEDTLEGQWGLSLHLESVSEGTTRRYLLDFGYTGAVLNHNLAALGIDVAALDGLILSHGHLDHYGGLIGFLDRHRAAMRDDLALHAGGEDVFCDRYLRQPDGSFLPFGRLDRRELAARKVALELSEEPRLLGDHAFTTGAVPRGGIEKVLPNTMVSYGLHDGVGCDIGKYSHFRPSERAGEIVPDQHWHEQAICYHVKDRGLVVITSCGHNGILNNLRWVREITGIGKFHALVGGFHLAPAPPPYLDQVMAGLQEFDIDFVIPMHCSGENFTAAARQKMPEKLIQCATGSSFTFGA